MAVAMTMQIPGGTTEMYDALNREMGTDETMPDGLIAHYAASNDDGLMIFDVWESQGAFERFSTEMLQPAIEKVSGGQAPAVEPTFAEIHNEEHR